MVAVCQVISVPGTGTPGHAPDPDPGFVGVKNFRPCPDFSNGPPVYVE